MKKKIVIIGAGISGLSLAWYLQKRWGDGADIQILEKSQRAGGWLYTKEVSGFLFEMGPRTFKASRCESLLGLIQELGLSDQLCFSSKESHRRFIYHEGKLELLPSHPFALFSSPLTKGCLLSLLKEPFVSSSGKEDESVYEFISRRLNAKLAERLFDPFSLGIYAGDIRKLSIRSCFPLLYEWEKKKGSLTRGLFSHLKEKRKTVKEETSLYSQLSHVGLFSLQGGNFRIAQALTSQLKGKTLYGKEVLSLQPKGNQVEITLSDQTIFADQLFLATPSKEAARLLSFVDSSTLSFLKDLPTVTLIAVNVAYRRRLLKDKAFGYLIPSSQGETVLGVVWDSVIFPEKGKASEETRLTVVLGGAHHPEASHFTEEKCVQLARSALARHLGIADEPDAVSVTIAKDTIPQFEVGHLQRFQAFEKEMKETYPQIGLVGNYLESVSLNGCIERSKKIAKLK